MRRIEQCLEDEEDKVEEEQEEKGEETTEEEGGLSLALSLELQIVVLNKSADSARTISDHAPLFLPLSPPSTPGRSALDRVRSTACTVSARTVFADASSTPSR